MKRPDLPRTTCTTCNGTGHTPGERTGELLRREREAREVPRIVKRMPELGLAHHFGFKETYVLDLERGARSWTWDLVSRYRAAIEAAVAARLKYEENK